MKKSLVLVWKNGRRLPPIFHLAVNNSHILQIFQLLLPVDMAGTVMPVEGVDSDLLGGSNAVVGGKKAQRGRCYLLGHGSVNRAGNMLCMVHGVEVA